jgi:hypothetical protein
MKEAPRQGRAPRDGGERGNGDECAAAGHGHVSSRASTVATGDSSPPTHLCPLFPRPVTLQVLLFAHGACHERRIRPAAAGKSPGKGGAQLARAGRRRLGLRGQALGHWAWRKVSWRTGLGESRPRTRGPGGAGRQVEVHGTPDGQRWSRGGGAGRGGRRSGGRGAAGCLGRSGHLGGLRLRLGAHAVLMRSGGGGGGCAARRAAHRGVGVGHASAARITRHAVPTQAPPRVAVMHAARCLLTTISSLRLHHGAPPLPHAATCMPHH